MNKKKLLVLAMTLSIVAILAIGGTLAYFTAEKEETNTITIGNIDINLYESQYHRGAGEGSYLAMTGQPQPLTDEDIVADDATYHDEYLANATLMPFDLKADHRVQYMFEACTVAKNAYVQNTDQEGFEHDVFVRVKYYIPEEIAEYLDIFYVDTQFITADDEIANTPAIELNNEDTSEPMITTVNSKAANAAQQIVTKEDGQYVASFTYAERLTPGEFTLYSPISKITLIPTATVEQLDAIGAHPQFDIKVEAEAIQADGFATALEAFQAFDAQMKPQL